MRFRSKSALPPILVNSAMELSHAFQRQNPDLSSRDIQVMTGKLLTQVTEYVSQGYLPAVAKTNPDNTVDVVILNIGKRQVGG